MSFASETIWREVQDPIATSRVRLAVVEDLDTAGLIEALEQRSSVRVTTLGRFSVSVGGVAVPRGAWQSRLARELLKFLVARGGRPATREAIAEELWAGEPYSTTGPRLSVLLTRLRKILDPSREHATDFYLDADASTVALRTDRVRIDVVEFLAAASDGAQLAREGRHDEAEILLRSAEQLFVGGFLSEERDAEWVVECRERTWAASITCARLLARIAAVRGQDEDVAHWLMCLLERDPYDESAWIALISAHTRLRRHGEVAHDHAAYRRRMRELDLVAEPLDAICNTFP